MTLDKDSAHFWLVRHGETAWNAQRRLQGWRDIPLNDAGKEQALQLARHLASGNFSPRIDAVLSSDLARAHETALTATAHLELPVITNPALRERNYGVYEGKTLTIVRGRRAGLTDFDLRDPTAPVKDGEVLQDFAQRIRDAFETLAHEHRGQNVLVFSHGGVIDIVWRLTQQLDLDVFRPDPIVNASINEFRISRRQDWQLVDWGQTGHLDQPALPLTTG